MDSDCKTGAMIGDTIKSPQKREDFYWIIQSEVNEEQMKTE